MTEKIAITQKSPNHTVVTIGTLTLHFSYETIVAFKIATKVVSENVWGTTTGKHLNAVDGGSASAKKRRLPYAEFLAELDKTLLFYGLERSTS
jgi:hypothetical protein